LLRDVFLFSVPFQRLDEDFKMAAANLKLVCARSLPADLDLIRAESGGVQKNSSYTSDGYSVGGSHIFSDGLIGLSHQTTATTCFIPGLDSARGKNHIDLRQIKWNSRGE